MGYGQRSTRELEVLWVLETSIASIAAQFMEENAFNYSQEVEIAAHLMVQMRETFGATESVDKLLVHLTRMEWRCLPGRAIDLALVHPSAAEEFRRGWGTSWGKIAKTLPLLAAIQIKRGGGTITKLDLIRKDLKDLDDVQISDSLEKPVTYFLTWVDSRLKSRPKQHGRYLEAKNCLGKWCSEAPEKRRALLLSRDRVGVAFPKGAWLVQPTPPGTVDTPE